MNRRASAPPVSSRMQEPVEVVPYRRAWRAMYRREARRLDAALGRRRHEIAHIGSTAVTGLAAKPIIDIAVRLRSTAQVRGLRRPLAALSYVYMGTFGLPGRHFFIKGSPRQYHLHVVDGRTEHWKRWIVFRDALRRDAALRKAYERLKTGLARRFRRHREKYTAAKTDFVDSVLAREMRRVAPP